MSKSGDLVLSISNLQKRFGGAIALKGASIKVRAGEIHALLGENGAGKSTLLKVLAGVHTPEDGVIKLFDKDFITGSPQSSIAQGIAVIYQEPSLFLDLTLAENVFIGRQPMKSGRIDWAFAAAEAKKLFHQLGVDLDPNRVARGLSIADQQVVEIAKALSMDAKVILMDEPTAALSASEVARLMTVMRSLRDSNKAVIFVSHRLDEVFEISDFITVMRDGATVSEAKKSATSLQQVIKDMVGRELTEMFPKTSNKIGEVILEVKNLSNPAYFRNVSFSVRKGEIVDMDAAMQNITEAVAAAVLVNPIKGSPVGPSLPLGTRAQVSP